MCVLYHLFSVIFSIITLSFLIIFPIISTGSIFFPLFFLCTICTIFWCWGTPSTVVFRGFTAICFLQNSFMEVIAWTPSWFSQRASTMEPSLWRQTLSGMLRFYSSSASDTGSKSFDCALVLTLESYDDPENGNYNNYDYYIH